MATGVAGTQHAVAPNPARFSLLTRDDLYLFNQGRHFRLYEKLGAHVVRVGDRKGAYFAVWAPNAE
ncbi:MAG: hypothetical protein Q7R41_08005, partial [Phycisphaerales bacterium]|nr:hypothetical protein [Phycisphaerales bacterium]